MPITLCRACNKPLFNRRPQTRTCNAACRAKHWRYSKVTMIPVSMMLNLTNYALVKKAAESAGKSINDYVHGRVISESA